MDLDFAARLDAATPAVVDSALAMQPGAGDAPGRHDRTDAFFHLSVLADALATGRPELFDSYLAWAAPMMAARGHGREQMAESLSCLARALANYQELAPAVRLLERGVTLLPGLSTDLPSFLDTGDNDAVADLARTWLEALLAFDRDRALAAVLDAAGAGMPLTALHVGVFQRCQREVGRLWQLNRISIAQEHYCSTATMLAVSQLYPFIRRAAARQPPGGRLVAACVGNEMHEIGLRLVTDSFEAEGWRTVYLGANVPVESLIHTLEIETPDVLALSVTMTFNLRRLAELIGRLRHEPAGKAVRILVGGYPFNVAEGLWRDLGADAHAGDAAHALALAKAWRGAPAPRSG